MKKWLNRLLEVLISPITLGILISALLAYMSKTKFYDIEGSPTAFEAKFQSPTYSFFKSLHDQSIDARLLARGPRKGSPQVAVLAVDNASLEEIGRWPWTRTLIAQVIDKTIGYGARVIGFDMVFSESEQNKLHTVLHNLRDEVHTSNPEIVEKIDHEIANSDTDQILAQSVSQHGDHLVMGSFNPNLPELLQGHLDTIRDRLFSYRGQYNYQAICEDLFQESSRTTQLWQNSNSIIGASLEEGNDGSQGLSVRSTITDTFGDTLRAIQANLNANIIKEWLNKKKQGIASALPSFIQSAPIEDQIHFLDLLINENMVSIINQTAQITGQEVSDEVVHQYLNEFRLALPNGERVGLLREMKAQQLEYCTKWLTAEDPNIDQFKTKWAEYVAANQESSGQIGFDQLIGWLQDPNSIPENIVERAYDWTLDIPTIANVSSNIGYFNATIDFDGTVRRTQLLIRDGNNYVLSLALRTFMNLKKLSPMVYLKRITDDPANNGKIGVDRIELTDLDGNENNPDATTLRPRNTGDLYINYAGKQKMFPHVSAKEILSDSDDMYINERIQNGSRWDEKAILVNKREFLKDKILIFGVTATAVYDLRVTPFEENYPGVETHANVVDNLIRNDFLLPNMKEKALMPVFLLVAGIILSVALGTMSATSSLLITLASLAGIYYTDKIFFFSHGTLIAVVFPLFLIFTIYVALTFYRYVTEERKKKELRTTFAKYVSPQIVNEVLADPENLQLGGRKETMTVFFSDVRGFTTISEKLDPEALSDLLNEYLTPMTELVFANRGTLDKYMGDAVMAFFGAPIPTQTHAKDACRCALQSIKKTFELQKVFQAKGYPLIDIGIGLNTGEMSVGNMGSNIVRNYTVMGDAVNLGSRLEGINKEYGTRIIISEFTQKEVAGDFITREVDWVRVKGKLLPVRIFELMAEGKVAHPVQEMLNHFNQGFELYHNQQWSKALAAFEQALQILPEDPVSKLYIGRCQGYLAEPPEDNWDGVFVMKTK